MRESKSTFNVLASVEKHIEALKPLLPRQAIVCIGEYPIKTLLKEPGIAKDGPLPILIDKSSDEIYKWIPRGFRAHHVLGFEDEKVETHFWFNILPTIAKDETVLDSLKRRSIEKLHGALIFASTWDGMGSAGMPAFISKLKASSINSFSIALLPSKLQPIDAQFNTYAALTRCQTIDGAAVLLIDRDHLESYESVSRQGEAIRGPAVANYLVNLFLSKETFVDEVTELSRTFNSKLFSIVLVTGASYKIFGSIENMLNTALLKPLLTFDLSSSKLLYVLLRMPESLKDKLPRGKIELAIANWFKDRADLDSVYITEPVYTEDMNDRIDVALLIGGFDTSGMFANLEKRTQTLKNKSVERGLMTVDWQVPKAPEPEPQTKHAETPAIQVEAPKTTVETPQPVVSTETVAETKPEAATVETPKEEPKAEAKPRRARRTRQTQKEKV